MNVFSATNGELSINAAKGNPFINLIESSFVSRDRGATWKAIASPIKNYAPPVQILHDKTLMIIGINSTSLLTSTDDGVTWTETGTVSKGGTTLPLRSGALLDIEDGRYGWFLINASPDNGKQWSAEYSTVNHTAFAAVKKDK